MGASAHDASDLFYEAIARGAAGTTDDYRAIACAWGFKLADIKTEVIIWQGEEDNLTPPALGLDLANQLGNGLLVDVPLQGHFLLHRKLPEIACALQS